MSYFSTSNKKLWQREKGVETPLYVKRSLNFFLGKKQKDGVMGCEIFR